jgi:hypothetical protein
MRRNLKQEGWKVLGLSEQRNYMATKGHLSVGREALKKDEGHRC